VLLSIFFATIVAGSTVQGVVRSEGSGEPIAHATVEVPALDRRVRADVRGIFRILDLPAGRWAVTVRALGYETASRMVDVDGSAPVSLVFLLAPQPVDLAPVNVTARRQPRASGAAEERALHEREVIPGVVGISRREIRDLPSIAEPDVMRALQVLPGVTALNDYNAALHVRGGGPDQNVFLLDGARIFAPYHLFGMMGVLNADAVERVEFFRGAPPARFGGGLSSVVDIEQRSGGADGERVVEGGVSLLGIRALSAGTSAGGGVSWMLAGRRTHADLVSPAVIGRDFPYAFYDVQGRLELQPLRGHDVQASFFTSKDRYKWFISDLGEGLQSDWGNALGSARWRWSMGQGWSSSVGGWSSAYHGTVGIGAGDSPPETRNRVEASGLRAEMSAEGSSGSLRSGIEIETLKASLTGDEMEGGYFQGDISERTTLSAGYLEASTKLGPIRLAPGLRAVNQRGETRIEPRLGMRLALGADLALSAGVSRTYQSFSTLRDDRFMVPGAPMWFVHPDSFGVSRSDGVSLGLDGFVDDRWSYSLGAYRRRFAGVPRWRPEGLRNLSALAADDGDAAGVELFLRRHAGRLTGWIGYDAGRVTMDESDTGRRYFAAWDQTHSVDIAGFLDLGRNFSVSTQLSYGSGLPFWAPVGMYHAFRFDPLRGRVAPTRRYPVWSDEQERLPPYLRLDLGARTNFRVGAVDVAPFASIMNVTNQRNVLFYRAVAGDALTNGPPELIPMSQLMAFPSIGVDVRF
jgi:hypothetical protein